MRNLILLSVILLASLLVFAQTQQNSWQPAPIPRLPKVDYEGFEKLTAEAGEHRKTRMINVEQFLKMSQEAGTVILDTRSDSMYQMKHIKGAVHLNFSDFTQENLAKTIPSFSAKVLIYCNNNFDDDPIAFPSKEVLVSDVRSLDKGSAIPDNSPKALSLALNIPTFINLYGYGYCNVYELAEMVSTTGTKLEFEGTLVPKN